MAQLNFDARQVAPQTGFDPVPNGWYNVIVDETEMKPTKENNGSYLKVRYSILDGQFANRKIYTMITLQNANPQAVEIGLKQLSALAHAVGVLLVSQSEQLHNIPLKVKAKIRPAKDDYDASNSITQWENINAPVGDSAVAAAGAPAFAPVVNVAAQPVVGQQQQFAPPSAQPAPGGMPGWAGAPAAQQPAQNAAPAAGAWQAPAGQVQQPWQQPQQPVQQQAPAAAPAQQAAPGGFNPQGAVPPWAQR